jgi:TonB-dependent SusC/RagA subfamily outer membrane receptor
MTSFSQRAALCVWVLIALVGGCASGRSRPAAPAKPMVTAEDIEQNAGQPIEKVLQAKVPGVLITRAADGSIAIQIRGPASFLGSSEPLYVIDGVPFRPGPGGALTGVNPYDIESIQVLKDPADIGIYGVRGANGVIVVTTKQPGRRGG